MSATVEDSGTQAQEPGRVRDWLSRHVASLVAAAVALGMVSIAILAWLVFGLGVVNKHVTTVSDSQELARQRSEQYLCVTGYQDDFLKAVGMLAKADSDQDDTGIQIGKAALASATANLDRATLAQLCPLDGDP